MSKEVMPNLPVKLEKKNKFLAPIKVAFSYLSKIIGGGLTVLGIAGLPENLDTWSRWIDRALSNEKVLQFAEKAVQFSTYANQWWFRLLLVIAGITMLLWASRPLWRLRHRIQFRWRRALAEQVWISSEDALKVIKESSWGRLKEPNVTTSVNVFDTLSMGLTKERVVYGLSEKQKKILKFNIFIQKTLDVFCGVNPVSCKIDDGQKLIDEVALRAFLKAAIDEQIYNEFGDVPNFKVTE